MLFGKEYTDVIGSFRSISYKYTNSTNHFLCLLRVFLFFFSLFLLLRLLLIVVCSRARERGIFSVGREETNRKVVYSRKHFIMNFVSGPIRWIFHVISQINRKERISTSSPCLSRRNTFVNISKYILFFLCIYVCI